MNVPPSAPSDRPGGGGTVGPIEVLVVAYGSPGLLESCLAGLEDRFPVVVVDNSSDPAVHDVAARHDATYVDPGRNLGFAAGVNEGLTHRSAPDADLLLLNPDAVISPDDLDALGRCLHERDDLCAVAPSQVDPADGSAARVGWPFPSPVGAWIDAFGLGRLSRRVDFLIGSVLLIRAQALADVGGFDERYFLYAEETDWQRRARDHGWQVAVCRDASATHVGAGTGGDDERREVHFHASHERYIRAHHGAIGWVVYRAAQLVGASGRVLVLRGVRGRQAAARFRLYWAGPSRVEARLDPSPGAGRAELPHSVAHVVLTDGFAGVERYVCQVAGGLVARGHAVTVVGGDPVRMRAELHAEVTHRPASSLVTGVRALLREHPFDLLHVHMTAAEGAAFLSRPRQPGPVIATRHFAQHRGSSRLAKLFGALAARHIRAELAISQFVADSVEGPSLLLRNGVPDRPSAPLDSKTVVMLQRLDTEKAPEVGLTTWSASGLGAEGWRLVVAGSGELAPALTRLARELGIDGTVDFLGRVADTDGLLARAAVFLAPAPTEPFGLSVVEAMSHGLPVVAAGGGAHLETIGDDGMLFAPGDAEDAATLLRQLAEQPLLRRQVGGRLQARQRRLFSLERHLDGLEQVYRDVAGGASVTD